jgi:hypothetical protein
MQGLFIYFIIIIIMEVLLPNGQLNLTHKQMNPITPRLEKLLQLHFL